MPAPAFPTPPQPIPAETRLAYVLRHFRLAYENVPDVSIGYADTQPQLQIAGGAGEFFNGTNPYPAAPTMREWLGQSVPFFFDVEPQKPLLEWLPNGYAIINADIISGAFYLLSGWQEYYSEERDQHGRFPYSASVQRQYGFVTVPVVNYYFDVLKTAVEHIVGYSLQPRTWSNGAKWAAFITHDIDNLYSAWKAPTKAAFQRRDWPSLARHLWQHFTQKDAWDNLEHVRQTVASYGAKSTFFFLPEHRKAANGTPNADYKLRKVWQSAVVAVDNSEIGLHASLGTDKLHLRFKREGDLLQHFKKGDKDFGVRFHYLGWEPRITPTLVSLHGHSYDSTLGFAEHFGFRNSYCLPFYPFNLGASPFSAEPDQGKSEFSPKAPALVTLGPKNSIQMSPFLEIPLNVMDATLHHPRYLQLVPEEILSVLTPMFQEIERFGGVCTVLWHNENFDPANENTGPYQFAEIMEYLRSRAVAFVNGSDILGALAKHKSTAS
ncbi:hypothetical protein HMJ29_15455 [Hymenobacter taeanensis]|uniref:DUF7033 domain-containing protein n=1 Tax=Hymenobacter taeanensis TaxID=2735321 RepID=A0A6M6BK57_9BACT|nr:MULTISPECIES: hypothetical protein [Hymenobacter]QJX48248.1 hypothetical protein HMJ29_15455 [Hymenobacter taeanensis]UOQ82272.1 hypothetical protein MUN83_05745 [Hymenobacter sp. 5414T-23]